MDDNKLGDQAAGEPQDFAGQGHQTEEGLKNGAEMGQKAEGEFKQAWEKDLGTQGAENIQNPFDEEGKSARREKGMASEFARTVQKQSRQALAQSHEAFGLIDKWAHQNPWTTAGIMAGVGLIVGLLLNTKKRND